MSGLLRRLGARALGQPAAVRSQSTLPFAAAPMRGASPPASSAEAVTAAYPIGDQAPDIGAIERVTPSPGQSPGGPARLAPGLGADLTPPATSAGRADRTPTHPDPGGSAPTWGTHIAGSRPGIDVVPSPGSPRPAVAWASAPTQGASRAPLTPDGPTPLLDRAADALPGSVNLMPNQGSQDASAPGRRPPADDDDAVPGHLGAAATGRAPMPPRPLLPAQPPSTTLGGGALRGLDDQGDRRGGATAVAEPTEVHISIGRIEVTAITEGVTAKPLQPRRGAPPMTLDDYLARRRGGQP